MGSKTTLGLLLACIALAGCGSSTTDTKAKPKLDATLHQTVVDECTVATEGVKLCVDGRPEIPCVTTDNLGIADLAIPKNEELLISYSKDGFIPKLREYVSDQDVNPGLGQWFFQRKTWYDQAATTIGGASATFDYKKGFIGFQTDPLPGLTSHLDPLDGQDTGGVLSFQFKVDTGTGCPGPEPCASGTTCDVATVGYGDVPVGKWKAYFTAPTGTTLTCTAKGFACKDGTPGCVEIESRAGYNNFGFVHCTAQ